MVVLKVLLHNILVTVCAVESQPTLQAIVSRDGGSVMSISTAVNDKSSLPLKLDCLVRPTESGGGIAGTSLGFPGPSVLKEKGRLRDEFAGEELAHWCYEET